MRNYESFKAEILKRLEADIHGQKEIRTNMVKKLNMEPEEAVLIMKTGTNVAPTIYLEQFYHDYEQSGNLDSVYQRILTLYNEGKMDEPFDTTSITDFEKAKPRITVRLVNRKMNESMLEDIPHIVWLDLAIVFYVVISRTSEGLAATKVTYSLMEKWGRDKNPIELFPLAMENTERISPVVMRNMYGIPEISEMMDGGDTEKFPPMYVMTNTEGLNGAVAMLHKDTIREFSEKFKKDIYILPSSIHEIILHPAADGVTLEEMTEMVRSVNSEAVETEDILSDHAYLYVRETDEIEF